tara:strand:+ start:187 stop:477 length:291 start_codon:yes stop_codon:yes gene_type:complete
MKIKFNKIFLKLLFILIVILNSNSYAENEKINKSISELRIEGFDLIRAHLDNGTWYVFLEKKATYQVDKLGVVKMNNDIKFVSCIFNDVKTKCYSP